jgi:crossover junction endodeoxyribonuclease RuvC
VAAMAGVLSTYRPGDVSLVVLEQSQAMPGQGVTSMFTVGVGFGLWWGIVATLGLPLEFVRPCVWVRAILKGQPGEGKARALGYVARRFPGAELTPPRCRAPRDGRADALCLAVWGMGRRNMGLGTY